MEEIEIKECDTLEALERCVALQKEVFALPEIEISPVRHFVVTKNAGGFTLGAFLGDELVGFVLSVPAFLRGKPAFYSHMTAVKGTVQGTGIGARLKWQQRLVAMERGVSSIKWTFEPWKARNAFFNLEKLGAVVTEYQPNFYGVDYSTASTGGKKIGLASDRLFAEWHLESPKVAALASGRAHIDERTAVRAVSAPTDWSALVTSDPEAALAEQKRLKAEFEAAFADGLLCEGFIRDKDDPRYLFFAK